MTPKRLTDEQVRTIRRLMRDPLGRYQQKDIAKRFGVSTTVIGKIKRGEIYTEVKDG